MSISRVEIELNQFLMKDDKVTVEIGNRLREFPLLPDDTPPYVKTCLVRYLIYFNSIYVIII